jgi:uncharacterized GH25 family protein
MKKKIALILLVSLTINVAGHEFWLQPDKFIYKRTEPVNIKFLLGENFDGKNWTGKKDKINSLRLYFDNAVDKNLSKNFGSHDGDSLQLAMIDEGTVMISLNTKNSFIELEAEKFNNYLHEEGLINALEYRKKNNETSKKGSERYQRCSKTIFQVGEKLTNVFPKKTNLLLDIIPASNPYNVVSPENFKVKILFKNEKLKNTKVKVWHKIEDTINEQDYTTNDEGELSFDMSHDGEWMISCVKMEKLKSDSKAEWQSYCGSLTWGYY